MIVDPDDSVINFFTFFPHDLILTSENIFLLQTAPKINAVERFLNAAVKRFEIDVAAYKFICTSGTARRFTL